MKTALQYKDVCLLPNYSSLQSRALADTSVEFVGRSFDLPVIPSNMKCVIDEIIAKYLSENNYFYVMHRFDTDIYEFVERANEENWSTISISIGVGKEARELIDKLDASCLRVDYITIDIAHGFSELMCDMLQFLRSKDRTWKIIAGNVATTSGFAALHSWGANAVKVGIGGGGVCSTKNKTGFTMPMYSCIKNIKKFAVKHKIDAAIIADGGVRENGDITKAIHAGADMVMAGGIFSRLIDSPAELVNGHKVYFGSASQFNKGEYKNVEGIKRVLDLDTMTYKDKLREIQEDLQSSISYAGGRYISDIRRAKVMKVNQWETQV